MTAARMFDLPARLHHEIVRLHGLGFNLLPLGGADGKVPLRRKWIETRASLSQVLGPLFGGNGSMVYGIRLDGLTVLDCDEDDPELVMSLEARFGASPVHVKTPRGLHLYYSTGDTRPNLKGEGLPVDVKAGANQYVVGPGSIRPDGGAYIARLGILGACDLPKLVCAEKASARVPVGGRNDTLWKEAIGMVEHVDSVDDLIDHLAFLRDGQFDEPTSVSEAELRKVSKWAWAKRCENSIYSGRDTAFRIERDVVDRLGTNSDALALYVSLQRHHGHQPGKTFGLNHKSMKKADLTDLSRERFRAARRALEAAYLLEEAEPHRKGVHGRQYRLCRPVRVLSDGILELRSGKKRGRGL